MLRCATESSFLFGDELNKEVEELTKLHRLSNKVTPRSTWSPTRSHLVEVCGHGHFSQSGGHGRTPASSYLEEIKTQ